jgi:hypothetical protein
MESLAYRGNLDYHGDELHSLFAYGITKKQGDSIISFIGKCNVKEHLVDVEDILNKDYIYSEKMLHFIIEHFPADLELMVTRQRLLMCIIQGLLADEGIRRDGDDLISKDGGKLSVSIATVSHVSSLMHVGLNVVKETKAPVKTCSLEELGMKYDEQIESFATNIKDSYIEEIESIKKACYKVRGVN